MDMQHRGRRWLWLTALAGVVLAGCQGGGVGSVMKPMSNAQLTARIDMIAKAGLASEDAASRSHALEVLAQRGGLEAGALVRPLLYDRTPAVRFAAAVAVGDLKDQTSRRLLQTISLQDDDPLVQLAAGYALECLGDTRFANWYDNMLMSDEPSQAGTACMLLGKLGVTPTRTNSAEKLWRVMRKPNQHTQVRLQAAEALAQLGDEKVLRRLLAYAGSSYADDKMLALRGLGQIDDINSLAMITALTDDPQLEVRLAAYRELGDAIEPDGLAEVRKSLFFVDDDKDRLRQARVRGLAALALGTLGEEKDAALLYKVMDDPAEYVRLAGAHAALQLQQRHQQQTLPARGL